MTDPHHRRMLGLCSARKRLAAICLVTLLSARLGMRADTPSVVLEPPPPGWVNVAVSPDGRWLAFPRMNGWIRLWDIQKRSLKYVLTPPSEGLRRGGSPNCVSFSPDGQSLASVKGAPLIWDVQTGMVQHILRVGDDTTYGSAIEISPVFSPDGSRIASGFRKTLRIWDKDKATLLQSFPIPDEPNSLAWSGDGGTLVYVNHESIGAVNAATGEMRWRKTAAEIKPLMALACSPDGAMVAGSGYIGASSLWDTRTGTLQHELTGLGQVYSVSFAPDGKSLAGIGGGGLCVWNARTGGVIQKIANPHDWMPLAVCFLRDGHHVAESGLADGDYAKPRYDGFRQEVHIVNIDSGVVEQILTI